MEIKEKLKHWFHMVRTTNAWDAAYSANGGICVNGKQTEEGKRIIGKL